jgi:signal transduction histidine kinase/CheY-like chemotaxis protein
MKIWGKKPEKASSNRGVSRAALEGATRAELVVEALSALARSGISARLGVWLEPDLKAPVRHEQIAGFHGAVWDQGQTETPREWAHLSIEPPLPEESLFRGKTVQQDLASITADPIMGLLAGLRNAIWVPVFRNEHLHGVILVGNSRNHPVIPPEQAESVAAELALALGLEHEEQSVRRGRGDLEATRNFLSRRAAADTEDLLLNNLVESFTSTTDAGPGAAFAVIGVLPPSGEKSGEPFSVDFRWRSGEPSWTHTIESEPLANVWKQALAQRRVIGRDSQAGRNDSAVSRIVAFPLVSACHLLGVMVVGLPASALTLVAFERLEMRAVLAASALLDGRRKEESVRLSQWPQKLLDSISEPLLLLDDAGMILGASRGARELTASAAALSAGAPLDFSAQPRLPEIFCGRERQSLSAWLRAALERGAAKRDAEPEPLRSELHNGTLVRLRLSMAAEGQPYLLFLETIATRKAGSQAEYAEIELQSVIEWLEEGVVLFDSQDNVRAMNTRFEQIAGLAPEESGKFRTLDALIERLGRDATDPARFSERWRDLSLGIEGGVREELQMAYPSSRILERAARPVLDPVGRLLGRVEIYRDLTAHRVFHAKLLQTEKLAALGQMVSGVAHELSNPLTSIMGYAHRLLARHDLPGRTEEVRQIYQEADRASTILRQLLLNARETLPERRFISLNQIVQRALDLQRFSLATEKIRVEADLDPALPFVNGDPGHLQQVLMNLVGNARQAIEQQGQGGMIRLRTRRIGERRVLLEVSDSGPGIPHAILARIFDPFFTTKPAGVGTGLGLAIVLSVVREHGGQVHVLSPPPGGAIFQIELPADAEVALDEPALSSFPEPGILLSAGAIPRPADPFSSRFEDESVTRVLVVEDEPTVARLIADVLEDEGMRVEVLLDGREALDRAARQSFDLVICDMKMPGLDGQNFYKSLERSGNPLREKFLFVTGDIIAAQTREFLDRNHLPHVAKPFRVEELTEKVHGVLKVHVRQQPPPEEAARKNAARNG